MEKVKKIVLFILKIFISNLKDDDYQYFDMRRNSKCYCNSGKKYKNCHLLKNDRKGLVAISRINRKTNESSIKILSKAKARKLRGIFNGIEVQNTFRPTELMDNVSHIDSSH